MKHHATPEFWEMYAELPKHIQELADKNFALLKADTKHPSLHFKKIAGMWSVRVGAHYRALGFDHEGEILWFWIDSHSEYDKMMP